ncbi:MAG: DNA repair exonuclease, partial [Candidatus Aenigmarchaeota archaeon]|nr:DNA repair exonuclease [Candidatus Aenigmarchaeota archaeon]
MQPNIKHGYKAILMKMAVMSDFHFGYGAGTELEADAFEAVEQALELSAGCDLILMPGDLFDTRVPSTETLAKAMQLLIKPSLSSNGARFVRFVGGKDGSDVSPRSLSGIPIVTIHGTHERRTKELMNPVQALEKAGFAIHLHCNGVVFEKNDDKVAIFGLSGVPDPYAGKDLKEWSPKPEPGCYNIFMLHQNIREFMPSQVEHAIPTDELPNGFDLYVCGHIHEARKEKKGGKPFLLPGSLIPTQLDKASEKPRGFFVVDTKNGSIDFMELEKQRRVFVIEETGRDGIISAAEKALSERHAKKPLIRVKLPADADGNLAKELRLKYEGRAILSIRQEAAEDEAAEKAKTLEEHVLSVQEMGRKLLAGNLRDAKLDPNLYESLFELIVEGRLQEAEALVLGKE